MDEQNLTPEHIATLLDLAEKIQKRRGQNTKSGAVVKHHDWTVVERRLYAAKNDLKTAQFVYERTRVAKESADKAFDLAQKDLEAAEVRIQEAIKAAKTD